MRKAPVYLISFIIILLITSCAVIPDELFEEDTFNVSVCIAAEPKTIDPALNITVDGAVILHHFFEGLIKWVDAGDGTTRLAPGIAEYWEISDDGRVYTFHLREDALWSDGEPVTAYDFEYAWKRVVDPLTDAGYSYMLDCVKNGPEIIYDGTKDAEELAAVALDEHTFEVTLHTAIPYFEEIAAFSVAFPVRKDVIESYGNQWIYNKNTYITNGPYTMNDWVHHSYITMVANENYYNVEEIGPDSIRFALMNDHETILAAYRNSELDFIAKFPADEMPALREEGKLKTVDHIGTYYISFQTEQPPFDDPRVREAFSMAIDRNKIADTILGTGETPAVAYIPPGIYDISGAGSDFRSVGGDYYSIVPEDYKSNCEMARSLLAEAGYPSGENFPDVNYLYYIDERNRAIGEALQNMWQAELGVKVRLNEQEPSDYLEWRKDGLYFMAANSWIADYNDPISFMDIWVSEGGNNIARYRNPDYDELVMKAKTTWEKTERMQILHEAENLLMKDHVVAPIFFKKQVYAVADNLDGVIYSPLGHIIFSYCKRVE